MNKEAPLTGLRVIDQTQALAGPYCAMMLGDMGADVIKIERPGVGDQSRHWAPPYLGDQSTYYLSANRNKRSLALNIASDAGKKIMHELLADADIFITNLATRATLQKYALDYETLNALNPCLIYASISGYGRSGSRADQPGYDIVAQAESGLMSVTGASGESAMRFPTAIADMACGLFTLSGIMTALYVREKTGRGQFLDQSLQEGYMNFLGNHASAYFATGETLPRSGNRHPQITPYEPVQGADGDWFILGVGSDNLWRAFCKLIERDDLLQDARYQKVKQRVEHYETLMPVVREIIRQRSTDDWLTDLRAAGIPAGRINSVGQALSDAHLRERGAIINLEHPVLGMIQSLATPISLSETPLIYYRHPPRLGEHSHEILSDMGYENAHIQTLRKENIIEML